MTLNQDLLGMQRSQGKKPTIDRKINQQEKNQK